MNTRGASAPRFSMEQSMARRPKTVVEQEKQIDDMIVRFQAQDAQEAPQKPEGMETVMLIKKTFLYGAVALAGASVEVPTTIANVLRAKGIIK